VTISKRPVHQILPLFIGLLLSTSIPRDARAARVHESSDPIPGQYLVLLEDGVARDPGQTVLDGPSVAEVARGMSARYGLAIGRRFEHVAQGFVARTDRAGALRLAADPRVARVEQDAWAHASGVQMNPPSWGLDRIDQRPDTLDGRFAYGETGAGLHVFIVDTGIRSSHADFGGRVATAEGFTAVSDGWGTEDCNGHGTFVAGLVGGATYGAAKGVTLHPVRVLGCDGRGSLSDVIAGIDWIATAVEAHQKGKPSERWRGIANVSLEAPASYTLDLAVRRSIAQGIAYVVAAGSGGGDACEVSPARVAEALTVAATDSADQRPAWSNVGPCIDLFAPGVGVTSSYNRSDSDQATGSGTSMAAPHATAVTALLAAAYDWATPDDLRRLVVEAASPDRVIDPGPGSPNRLLYSASLSDGVDDPPYVTFTAQCRAAQRTCSFDAGSSVDDVGIASWLWDFGDGTVAEGRSHIRHRYPKGAPGPYTVTLTVTDTAGQIGNRTVEVGTYWY
jgi:serine protease